MNWTKQVRYHFACALLVAYLLPVDAVRAQHQVRPLPAVVDRCVADIESRIASATAARKYDEAIAAAEEFRQVTRARFGEESRCFADALAQGAAVLQVFDRGIEAAPLFERALGLFRKYASPDDPKLTLTLNNLGVHYYQMRQYDRAARVHEEALELRRKRKPLDETAVAESLHNLADAYRYLGRPPDDVLKLYQEALDIKIRVLKPNDVSIGHTRQNLASAQEARGELNGASRNLEQALALYRRVLPPDDPRIAGVIIRQAILRFLQGAYTEAEVKFREALRLQRAATTTPKSALAGLLDDFALNQMRLGRMNESRSLAHEALEIRRAVFPENHPTLARTLSNLSYLAWLGRDYSEALKLARQASDITIANGGSDPASRLRLQRHLAAAWSEATREGQAPSPVLADEAFVIGQRAIRSDTAATVSRTALRFSATNAGLRGLLKEVDDIDRELLGLEQGLTHALTLASDQSAEEFGSIRTKMAASAARRKDLLGEIEKSFPDYARLINPKPLTWSSVRALLEPDEALVMVVVGYEEIHVWCATRDELVWRKLDMRPQELETVVGTLRASLEVEPEDTSGDAIKQPLFDLGLAHELYAKLLGQISPVIASKAKLLVVPSGPLTSLPLHLLVSSKPAIAKPTRQQATAFRDAEWLANRFAVSVLPSVESFEALRRRARPTADHKPMIGFANPLPNPGFVPPRAGQAVASAQRGYVRHAAMRRGLPGSVWGKRSDNIEALRGFLANNLLENSGPELMAVGRILGADPHDLFTGASATETAVKQADLASYRVVYFATHGYVAGAFDQTEPSLALTVPEQPSEFDDGLLTASEIAQLTLDADWVILSACDTAAGAAKGAEGLSGLARAFFHAGARALLVSHWTLDDKSAMEVMTEMFGRLRADNKLSRSQAFRQAMLAQIRSAGAGSRLWDAYPGRWAVFEMVGVD
jgi:CHAT domain-containing protein